MTKKEKANSLVRQIEDTQRTADGYHAAACALLAGEIHPSAPDYMGELDSVTVMRVWGLQLTRAHGGLMLTETLVTQPDRSVIRTVAIVRLKDIEPARMTHPKVRNAYALAVLQVRRKQQEQFQAEEERTRAAMQTGHLLVMAAKNAEARG